MITEKPMTVIDEMERRMQGVYKLLAAKYWLPVHRLLSSREQHYADIRHCVRTFAWLEYGCRQKDISAAENRLRKKPIHSASISHSIQQFDTVLASDPDQVEYIRGLWDGTK